MAEEVIAGQFVAVLAILFNVAAMLYAVRKAKASRPPKEVGNTILLSAILVTLLSPFVLGSQRIIVRVPVYVLASILTLVLLWRVFSRPRWRP